MKKRTGEPWIPAAAYGALLPAFTVNLVVRDVDRSLRFYTEVLQALVHYSDADFAALKVGGIDCMLHADHTYGASPWSARLASAAPRGLGAELRLLGLDADEVAARAEPRGAMFKAVSVRGHGWREVMVEDPDGYVWAVGTLVDEGGPPRPATS